MEKDKDLESFFALCRKEAKARFLNTNTHGVLMHQDDKGQPMLSFLKREDLYAMLGSEILAPPKENHMEVAIKGTDRAQVWEIPVEEGK